MPLPLRANASTILDCALEWSANKTNLLIKIIHTDLFIQFVSRQAVNKLASNI